MAKERIAQDGRPALRAVNCAGARRREQPEHRAALRATVMLFISRLHVRSAALRAGQLVGHHLYTPALFLLATDGVTRP